MYLVWKLGMATTDDLPVCDIWPCCTADDDPDGCNDCRAANAALRGVSL
jgi:hypothetical protein